MDDITYECMSLLIGNVYSSSLSARVKQISPTRKRKRKPPPCVDLDVICYADMLKFNALFQIQEHSYVETEQKKFKHKLAI